MAGSQQGALIGVIEGGGTKFVCAVGYSPTLLERAVVPTTDPLTTLSLCVEFFRGAARRHGALGAFGVACFGPLQLQRGAPDYGCLLPTPKPGWSGASVIAPLRDAFALPVALDTDVGAAARGELHLGAGQDRGSLAYVTVGTGIGGAVAPAARATGLMHAEMGHLIVRRDPQDAWFAGVCPFHGDCLEGLASGPAIRARWGCDLSSLPLDHPGRRIIASYLGQLAATIALMHSPETIVFGGGVMSDGSLLPHVQASMHSWLAGYLPPLREPRRAATYLQSPALGSDSALSGAALLALDTLTTGRSEA